MPGINLFHSPEEIVVCDGGTATTLYKKRGFPVRHDAGFEALFSPKYNAFVRAHETKFCEQANEAGVKITLDTLTYRASRRVYDLCGTPAEVRGKGVSSIAVGLLKDVRNSFSNHSDCTKQIYVVGCIGPMEDAYNPRERPTVEVSRAYHMEQVSSLSTENVDYIGAYTLTNSSEAIGIAHAAAAVGLPVVICFTLGDDCRLSLGETLGEAIQAVDDALDENTMPLFFGVNCVHPRNVYPVLKEAQAKQEKWLDRLKMFRGNASPLSHAELENSKEIIEGDPEEWAQEMAALRAAFPSIQLVGGCCGTGPLHQKHLLDVLHRKPH